MDWDWVKEWMEQMGFKPEEVYLALREYALKKEYGDFRSSQQLELPLG